ncbi:MAG: hypothetical protein GY898_12105 [Proteobacteria bacterium]|nr:hypothetical protein [Pseudomonadota bacterium]
MRAGILQLAVLLLALTPALADAQEVDPVTGYPVTEVVLVDMQVMPQVAGYLRGILGDCFAATTAFHREYIQVWAHFMIQEAVRRDPNAVIALPQGDSLPASAFVEMAPALYPPPSEVIAMCKATGDCLLAERVMTLGCAADSSLACIWLAGHYQTAEAPEGYWTSASLLLWACKAGDAKACSVFSGHVNPSMSWSEALDAVAQAGPFAETACTTDNDPLACAALGAQDPERASVGMIRVLQEQYLSALFGLAMTHCDDQGPLCQLAERLLILGGFEKGRVQPSFDVVAPSPTPSDDAADKPGRSNRGTAVAILPYVGLGAMRSLTLKIQANGLRGGVIFELSVFNLGFEGEFMTDNRLRPANQTYRRLALFGKIGAAIPLGGYLRLRIGGGPNTSQLIAPGGEETGSSGLHEYLELSVNPFGFRRRGRGLVMGLRSSKSSGGSKSGTTSRSTTSAGRT